MNVLSTKTLGHLVTVATTYLSDSTLKDLLMKSGIYDADIRGLDPSDLVDNDREPHDWRQHESPGPNEQELLRTPLLAARGAAMVGNLKADDALREFVQLVVYEVSGFSRSEDDLAPLREALLGDGYELCTDHEPSGRQKCRLLPIDPSPIPVNFEITALEAELGQRGYTEALGHYRSAVDNFTEQDHPASNGQLRNMVESLVKHLAVDHTGYVDTGRSGQGGAAINTLYAPGGQPPAVLGQVLPENDGGRMLRGIWNILHSNGPHPGLSDADEARIRMQLCTGLARFLLKHFPAKP